MNDVLLEAKNVGKRFGGATARCGGGPAVGGGEAPARGMHDTSQAAGHA